MKTSILLIILATAFFTNAQTNKYNVIKVNGGIFNVTQSSELSQGNSFVDEDNMNFKQNSFAYVISNMRKKYMLRTPNIESDDADIFSSANLALSPIRSRGQLSTRGAVSETGVKDFKTYLGIENFSIIGNQLEIPMDESRYPLNNEEFIVFHYDIKDAKISKKVGFNNQVLKIEKEKLKISNNNTLHSDTIQSVSVYKYKPLTDDYELITEINLCFLDSNTLKQELETILSIIKGDSMTPDDVEEYLKQYVIDIYGNMDDNQLDAFIGTVNKK